jgi:FdrA protein
MMSTIRNEVRRGAYHDSVALMRIARGIEALPGVEVAGLMIGTPANLEILREAGVLAADGESAGAGDIVIAVRATTAASADAAIAHARQQMDRPRTTAGGAQAWQPRTLRSAVTAVPAANLALISVPGDFAITEARKALRAGLNAMIFSDNVAIADEAELKREARELGLLVMGPDCGTAIIGGAPLAFANVVPRGDIGIIGASGTGIQEVSCLIAQAGRGISHAIGTGGRDLKAEVGGITTLMAIDLLDADPATRHIVIISKPPAAEVAAKVLERVGRSAKPFTVCFLGDSPRTMPANARASTTMAEAAQLACGRSPIISPGTLRSSRKGFVRGLFAGGTLAAEAQVVLLANGLPVMSNTPVPGASALGDLAAGHAMLDLGADEFTRGRPHPMIEPAVRDEPLAAALADPAVAVILLDCVLGFGGHMDPAGHLTSRLRDRPKDGLTIIASVTGTDADPQNRSAQVAKLEAVGVIVARSNASAAGMAADVVRRGG